MERARLSEALRRWSGTAPAAAGSGPVRVAEAAPARFIAALAAGVASGRDVVLGDPAWGEAERAQADALLAAGTPAPDPERGWLLIPTGGSAGRLKLARHDQDTLAAAVDGFTRHFGVSRVHAVGVLPLHHVSGLMGLMRSALTGGDFLPLDWTTVRDGLLPALPVRPEGWFVSLVPTQLERLLGCPEAEAWLRGFRAILVGGGPAWAELLERAAAARLPLAPSYGMTETAAMVTAVRPEEFLAGDRTSGGVLPHARVTVDGTGTITVAGGSLFRGYYPDHTSPGAWSTSDRGELDAAGRLRVLGRVDEVIITGGEKVDPAEVEAALRASGEFADVAVVAVPDARWGSAVVAAYPAGGAPGLERVAAALRGRLASFKHPKHYVALPGWTRSAAGKLDRAALARAVAAALRSP